MTLMCLVDGCGADLSDCRKYYQRHKVCEIHSKTPQVSINGQLLRFCQQCSRFHSLEEFDDGKRSCRKRLDGHNKRRRKPRPPSLFSPNNGTDTLRSSGQQLLVHPNMAHANRLWGGVAEAQTQAQALSWVDQSNGAPSLLSSYAAPPQAYTLSHVVHPPSDSGSFPMTATPLDEGPSYGVNLYRGVTDMDPHHHAAYVDDDQDPLKLPFYWGS